MSYWEPRANAPMNLCTDEACNQRADCRRYLERRELRERGAGSLPQRARWKMVPDLDANGRPVVHQHCESFVPRSD